MNIKAIAAAGLLVVGVGAIAVPVLGLGLPSSNSATTYRTSTATTTTVQQTVAASGNLVAATVYDLAFGKTPQATSGTTTSSSAADATSSNASATSTSANSTGTATTVSVTWPVTAVNVQAGDLVTKGDVLATADDTTAQLAVTQAEANLANAKAQKRTDLAGGTSTSRSSAKDQVASAKNQLSGAQSSYSSTVAQGNLQLKNARQSVASAKAQLKRDKKAHAPAATIHQDKAAITSAEQNLASARLQALSNNRSAANQVSSARLSVKSAQRSYRSANSSASDATIKADDVAIAQAQEALDDANEALAAATIVAPIDGRVTAVNAVVGTDSTGTAVELQSDQLALSVSIPEDDILSLEVGQQATVAISATGGSATGTVTSIDPIASTSDSSVVTYTVVVTLDDSSASTAASSGDSAPTDIGSGPAGTGTVAAASPAAASPAAASPAAASAAPSEDTTPEALPGMSADLTIVIAEAENAVAVPAIAVSGSGDTHTVRVLAADGTVETRNVQVGLVTSDLAQITSGISDGETVVTGSSSDRAASSTSTGTTGGGFNGGGFQRPRLPAARGRIPGSAMSRSIIELTNATRTYDLGSIQVHALAGASIQVDAGEFVAIIGPSGSGKSTLMNILGCLDRPTSGTYVLDGTPVEDLDDHDLAIVRSRMIGFVFQSYNLIPRTSALDNVATPLLYQGVPKRERIARATAALTRMGLDDRMHHEPSELSGGQQQRVAIARALVTEPRLILADEPTGNLDSSTGEEVLELFHELNAAGATIVLITHDSDVAVRASRQIHVRDGRIAA